MSVISVLTTSSSAFIGPTEGLVLSSRHGNGDQRIPLCSGLPPSSLLPFLSSLWGVYEPWRHSPTSAAAIISRVRGQKIPGTFGAIGEEGTAVMWDFETECNTIASRDGISRYKQTLAFGQSVVFFLQTHSSRAKSQRGKTILAETIHPMRERTESQTRRRQRSIHWSRESFLVPKCKEFTQV